MTPRRLSLFNTLDRRMEEFQPINPPFVGIYSCGPTVYWYQHIGNLRTYIFSDVLKRVLTYNGYQVRNVINITDVGHLTSDADQGEDKMIKAIRREGLPLTADSMLQIAMRYFEVFRQDFDKLNIRQPDVWCRATGHIADMIELIAKLEEKGYTYRTSVGLVFDTSKLPGYGELAQLRLGDQEYGARVEVDAERRNPSDFALWITNQPNHIMLWDSPWGPGFPGWHIECSAMSMKYLGEQFDIHTGGEEHIPVHHTNEIAQSEAATGRKFVNYWLHARWLVFKGEKMSKSKGEIYTITELANQGFLPLSYRYSCFNASYRTHLSFSYESLTNAQNSYQRLKNSIAELRDDGAVNQEYVDRFTDRINDDLDMPGALAALWELVRDPAAAGKIGAIRKMDTVFGLDLLEKPELEIPEEVQALVGQREAARKGRRFADADRLRAEVQKLGFAIDDTPQGPKVKRA